MRKFKPLFTITVLILLLSYPFPALAHCPLCTAGAGVAAGIAIWLGVKTVIVAAFLGGFAIAMAIWFAKLVLMKTKKEIFPYQTVILTIILYLLTVVPLSVVLTEYTSLPLYMWGDYGTIFNKTYLINVYYLGTTLGAFTVLISPYVSNKLTEIRKKHFPYQGVIVTLVLLLILSLILQIL